MNLRPFLAAAVVCWAAIPFAGFAQDWPRFRGENNAGVVESANIPAQWSPEDILWRIELPGIGHGSMAVAGERIFLLCAEEKSSKRIPVCINAKNGEVLWSKEYDTEKFKGHRFNSPASTTPALDEERVYYTWGTKERLTAVALTHEGAEVWKADLGPVKGGHGFGASPMVYGDLVVINNDQDGESSLIAVNKFNGDKVWEIPRKSKRLSYSIPVVLPTDNGDVLVFTNWQHGFTVVDPNTGDVLAELSTFNTEVNERAISSPVLAGDLVIGACGFTAEPKHCVAVKFDGKELKEVWRVERSVPHIPSPIVVGDYVYLWEDKGIGTCLNHQTGEEIWRKRIGGNFFGSPVSDGEKLFAVDDAGVVVAIAASPEFQELGRNPLGPDVLCRSTPAIANGNLYVRTFDELLAVKGR